MLCMPLNHDTRGMIGARELGLMKPTAVLVNIARGGVLDHNALLETLTERRIFAAALDVTEQEPRPRNHPLLALDNLVIALISAALRGRPATRCRSCRWTICSPDSKAGGSVRIA